MGGLGKVGREANFGIAVLLQEFWEKALVNERVASLKSSNLALVIVHANDIVAHLRETNCGNKSNIS
jgi:hypothetical protein